MALKLRREDGEESDRRYMEEARRLARVHHSNVLIVHGADVRDGRVGLWTELIEGETLEERLATGGALGAPEAIAIGRDLCHALAAIHGHGLLHGDVKTSNVMRERGGPAATARGRTRAGGRRESAAEKPSTASAETPAATIITNGRRDTSNVERNSASRVARPATCCAMSAPAATIAAATGRRSPAPEERDAVKPGRRRRAGASSSARCRCG